MKPSGRLKEWGETKKRETALLGDIQRFLLNRIDQPSDRRQDVLHPSEMAKADWCPRSSWFRLKGEPESDPQKKHGHQLENIFDEGHTIHDKWQQRLWDMGLLEGEFQCLVCGHVWWDTAPTFGPVPLCGHRRQVLRYLEVPIDGEERYLIAGKEDGKVKNRLVEVKSIGQGTLRMEAPGLLADNKIDGPHGVVYDLDRIWKDLSRPLGSHLRQTAIYAAIANENGMEIDEIVFIYEYKSNQMVKEFVVKVSSRIAEPLLEAAKDIKFALENDRVIPRPEGNERESKPCTECPFMTTCWASDDSPSPRRTRATAGEPGVEQPARRRRRTAADGPAGDPPARPTRRGRTASAGGSDRPRRQRSDVAIPDTDGVGGVSGDAPVGGGGRRRVLRG